jgi:hypothetical protein
MRFFGCVPDRLAAKKPGTTRIALKQTNALGWLPNPEKFTLVVWAFYPASQRDQLIRQLAESAPAQAGSLLDDFRKPDHGW